jgi:hypothetical protein
MINRVVMATTNDRASYDQRAEAIDWAMTSSTSSVSSLSACMETIPVIVGRRANGDSMTRPDFCHNDLLDINMNVGSPLSVPTVNGHATAMRDMQTASVGSETSCGQQAIQTVVRMPLPLVAGPTRQSQAVLGGVGRSSTVTHPDNVKLPTSLGVTDCHQPVYVCRSGYDPRVNRGNTKSPVGPATNRLRRCRTKPAVVTGSLEGLEETISRMKSYISGSELKTDVATSVGHLTTSTDLMATTLTAPTCLASDAGEQNSMTRSSDAHSHSPCSALHLLQLLPLPPQPNDSSACTSAEGTRSNRSIGRAPLLPRTTAVDVTPSEALPPPSQPMAPAASNRILATNQENARVQEMAGQLVDVDVTQPQSNAPTGSNRAAHLSPSTVRRRCRCHRRRHQRLNRAIGQSRCRRRATPHRCQRTFEQRQAKRRSRRACFLHPHQQKHRSLRQRQLRRRRRPHLWNPAAVKRNSDTSPSLPWTRPAVGRQCSFCFASSNR